MMIDFQLRGDILKEWRCLLETIEFNKTKFYSKKEDIPWKKKPLSQ